jgi:hypothetical protein
MRKWWIVWPLYAGLMGFALGGSFFFGLFGRNVTEGGITAQHEQQATNERTKSKKEESDEALAFYTLCLMGFTGVLAFATIGLGIATAFLYATGEKHFRASVKQSRDMQASIKAAETAAKSAESSNVLAREVFITEQRPWLQWTIPPVVELHINGPRLTVSIRGTLKNIGRSPAFEINYFGKLYNPVRGPGINIGIAYYAQHLNESMVGFALASALPTETVPMSFGPLGIEVSSLPQDERFTLYLAFHAKYEFIVGGDRRLAEIGTVYMVQPIGKDRIDFSLSDVQSPIPVALVEWSGARRMT